MAVNFDLAAANAALLLSSVVSFSIQQGIQLIVDPFLEANKEAWQSAWPFKFFTPEYAKRLLVGWLVFLIGMSLAAGLKINVLYALGLTTLANHTFLTVIVSGLIVSNAAEVSNSLVKWINYAKEAKKAEAGSA